MSEVATKDQEVIEKKREAWGKLGVGIHAKEMALQAGAQVLIQKAESALPKTIEDLPLAEATLKEIKAGQNSLMTQRMEITNTLDQFKKRLMQPEQSLDPTIKTLSDGMIKVKQDHELIQQAKVNKELEVRQIVERIKTTLAEGDYKNRQNINKGVDKLYGDALSKDIGVLDIDQYVAENKAFFGVVDFQVDKPEFRLKLVDHTEIDQILEEHWRSNPHAYVGIFHDQLEKKFSDYAVAYANKAEALKLQQEEAATREKQLKEDLENQKVLNTMEASAAPLQVDTPVKALKKVYEIDMPETYDNAKMILRAFYGNEAKAKPHLRITNWYKFTPGQAAAALCKLKNDDNAFEPAGIIFKEVSKL